MVGILGLVKPFFIISSSSLGPVDEIVLPVVRIFKNFVSFLVLEMRKVTMEKLVSKVYHFRCFIWIFQ